MALVGLSAGTVALAAGGRDLRGWPVHTLVDDCRAAAVHDLLVDARGRVRWLDLEVSPTRHVLFPSGQATAALESRIVWVPGLSAGQLSRFPAYDHLPGLLDASRQRALLAAYAAMLLRQRTPPPPLLPGGDVVLLSRLPEFRVAQGDADPRGWAVRGAGNQAMAVVEDLLVDPDMLRVRHLVCRVGEGERRVLLPVAFARLDAPRRRLRISGLTRETLERLPAWTEATETQGAADVASAQLLAARSPEEDPRLDPATLFRAAG